MRSNGFVLPLIALLVGLPLATTVAGCAAGASGMSSSGAPSPTPTTGDAQRAVEEADIVQLDGGRLYALSNSGTVSIVDVSTPGLLTLFGQTKLRGQPFEMYRRGDYLVTMSNGAILSDGSVQTSQTTDPASGALLVVLDVHDPARLVPVASLKVTGELADSRVVGDVLYLATYENAACYGCGRAPRTMVTSFDIADVMAIRQVEQVSFESNAPDGYNLPWGSNWKRSIFVTDQRLYIGGHADIDPTGFGTAQEGIVDVLDVTDPHGRLGVGARLQVAGAILSRWQLDERDGVLRVISQQGAGRTGNGIGSPQVDTFRVESAQSFTPLGHLNMHLPRAEGLRTVRFDGSRAYAITYNQTDPLFVIDLADPMNPLQKGQLFMPGFMFYLDPHGERVVGLGIDRADPNGSLNVSLFDVSQASTPRLLSRVAFGTPGITEDYEILDSEVSEDQDRIGKSFHVLPDGLIVAPFSALRSRYAQSSSCDDTGGGVQLVEWTSDTLQRRALLPLPGNPRRALENNQELLAVSDSNVRTFSLDTPSVAHQTADVVIGNCAPTTTNPAPSPGDYGGDRGQEGAYVGACAASPGGGGQSACWPIGFALVAFAVSRRDRGRPRTGIGG